MSTQNFPSIRDIFCKFDLTELTTAEYSKLEKQFVEKLGKIVPQFDKYDEIDGIATSMCIEAQTMGFEQGFAFAVRLLMNGGGNR